MSKNGNNDATATAERKENASGMRPALVPPTPTTALTPIEAAYVTMAEGEFRAAQINAQQMFNARLAVVWSQKAVPDGAKVTIHRTAEGAPAALSWDATQP